MGWAEGLRLRIEATLPDSAAETTVPTVTCGSYPLRLSFRGFETGNSKGFGFPFGGLFQSLGEM